MNSARRPLFWSLLACFIGACLWWMAYMPYRPDALYGAIPSNAALVSVHENLAGEWDAILAHPVTRAGLQCAGIGDEQLAPLASNTATRAWLVKLASDRTVIAYVPALGYQQKPAWVFATWVGNRSRWWQWQLPLLKSRDLRMLRLDEGRTTLWLADSTFTPPRQRLSLALAEGMVLGCLSEDPTGARWLVETAERFPTRPSVATAGKVGAAMRVLHTAFRATPAAPPVAEHPQAKHWGWLENAALRRPGDKAGVTAFTLQFIPDGRLTLSAFQQGAVQAPIKDADGRQQRFADGLIGSRSDAALIIPAPLAREWIMAALPELWAQAATPLLGADGDPLMFACVLDRDHGGRLKGFMGSSLKALMKGLKAPVLAIGVHVGSEREAHARMRRGIDQVNSRFGLALELEPAEPAAGQVVTIVRPGKSLYGRFEDSERVAYAIRDGWLILASHAGALGKLLEAPPVNRENRRDDATAEAWIHLDSLGKTVKDLAALLALASWTSDTPEGARQRERLEAIRACAEALRPLREARATLRTEGRLTRLDMTVGCPP
jgi:hypothetical protein